MADDEGFRRGFYQALAESVFLEPGDPRVVPLHQQRYGGDATSVDHDPIGDLATTIRWATGNTTMQIFSGFRGSGKTTDLLRLRQSLRDDGYTVLYVRIDDFVNVTEPFELGIFLQGVLAAMDDAARGMGGDPADMAPPLITSNRLRDWWERSKAVLTATSGGFEVGANLGVVQFKTELRENPSFRRQLSEATERSLGAIKREADAFTTELRQHVGAGAGLVLLVDSLDHADNRTEFQALMVSLQRLFERHATLLRLGDIHVVYTVPPYLRFIKTECGPVRMLTTVRVALKDGQPVESGIAALTDLVARREPDWVRLVGSDDVLRRLILLSGGHLRDLLHLLGGVAMHARSIPVTPAALEYSIDQYRNSLVNYADVRVMPMLDRRPAPALRFGAACSA